MIRLATTLRGLYLVTLGSHHFSTSTTTSGALQVPYPSLEDDDFSEDSEDNENYSTDEDYS